MPDLKFGLADTDELCNLVERYTESPGNRDGVDYFLSYFPLVYVHRAVHVAEVLERLANLALQHEPI